MGIDYDGKLLVGGDYDDVSAAVDKYTGDEDMCKYEVLEELGLSYASPYFDCDISECYIGFEFPDTPLAEGWHKAFEDAAAKWKELTGVDAKIMGVQNIW